MREYVDLARVASAQVPTGAGMSDDLARSIGQRVQLYRTAAHRTKTVVAGLAGITPDYLYQIERGQKVPTIAVLAQLAGVLGVSAAELLGEQSAREPRRVKGAAGDAIYRALTSPVPPCDRPPELPVLRRRVQDAWSVWQRSPHRYSQLTARLPALVADTEHALRAASASGQADIERAHFGCAADLYGLLRTVTKRLGRVDLSLLAADRAKRCAEAADDPVRRAAAHWNMSQVLLADGEPEAAEAVAMKAAERLQPLMAGGTADIAAMYGAVVLLAAVAAARGGDAWTARDRIHRAMPLAERTGERNTQWTAFGPTNVAMYAVSVEFECGEAVEGLRLAERVDHAPPPSIERRVAFLVDQAKGHEQRRDFASALTLLVSAEREAPEDMQYRPAVHSVLRSVAQRGRRHVASEAARLALRIGLPL